MEIADLDRDNDRIYKELSDAQENHKYLKTINLLFCHAKHFRLHMDLNDNL